MTVTLELKPELETRLARQAKAFGVPIEKYLEKIVEEYAVEQGGTLPIPDTRTPEEKEALHARLMEIVKGMHGLPTLDHRSPDEIIGYDDWGLPSR